jgi:MFS family permease
MTSLARTLLTPLYFIYKITALGSFLGALAGTLIVPILGTGFGSVIGLSLGAMIGAVIGTGYALLGILFGLPGLIRYRKWLVIWGGFAGFLFFFLVPILLGLIFTGTLLIGTIYILFSLIAGVATAYGVQSWFDWMTENSPRKLKIDQKDDSIHVAYSKVFNRLFDAFLRRSKWLFYLLPLALPITMTIQISSFSLATSGEIVAIGVVATVLLGLHLLAVNLVLSLHLTALILAANRLYFKADVHPLAYKNRLSVMAFFVTLFSTPIVTGFIGAPVAAIIATLAVRDYADWYNEASGKGKRKEKVKNAPSMSYQVDTVID